jgi:4,5:9,10-diseco-3-hydroxy-5,9,17-trioxoandrosta-1(10),2-diene-4-oate hydrolase
VIRKKVSSVTTKAVPEGNFADIGGGLRIHYHDEGQGPAVVFLHGSGPGASGWSNFRGNYPFLTRHGYRTIVPDTLGFGYSSKPDDVDYGMDFVAGGMRRFLDRIGIHECSLIGNSHGGAMAIKLAVDHPSLVHKLVLMAPGGLEEREVYMKMEGIRVMMKAFFSPEGITREAMRRVFGLQLFDSSRITEDIIEERFQIAETQPKRVLSTLQVPYLVPELGQIRCPVLGFWGAGDRFCPPSGAMTIAQSCKQARVLLLSECGHWVMVEHAELFNKQCLAFLDEKAPRESGGA